MRRKSNSGSLITQDDIDFFLGVGDESNISGSKFRIYDHHLKKESAADNVRFLQKEYGRSGVYPVSTKSRKVFAIDYDVRGIHMRLGNIVHPDAELLVTWADAERRIQELIQEGRYLTDKQIQQFPAWQMNQAKIIERQKVSAEILGIFHDYKQFPEQNGIRDDRLSLYVLCSCLESIVVGEKTTYTLKKDNYVLPILRNALHRIIDTDADLAERCTAALEKLNGPLFKHLEVA